MSDEEAHAAAPRIARVIETALYVDDLARAATFYDELLGFERIFATETLITYDVGGQSILLLFERGSATGEQHLPGGMIPSHDGSGSIHVAFAIDKSELPGWERRLAERGVRVEGRVAWPRGGVSVYFRDPDGHLLELATPGLWSRTY